jgi:hypothetical protein
VDVALLPTVSGGKPDAVVLTQPVDPAKLDALLQKLSSSGGPAPVSAHVGGWTVIGDSQAAVDAVSGATSHLADESSYQDATSKLDQGVLVEGLRERRRGTGTALNARPRGHGRRKARLGGR